MKDETKDKVCTCAWYLPDLALKSFLNKDPEEDVTVYTQENKRKLFLQWKENNYEELENSLEYGSLLLRFFVDGLKADRHRTLFELGALKGVVDCFEHLLYEKGEELRLLEAKRISFSTIKHLDEVVFALETHGSMTQTELRNYMQGMNASTLSEAMKKILATGLVASTVIGKYTIYTLTDTGLEYGKLVRKGKEENDLPHVLKVLQAIIDRMPTNKERIALAEKLMALFADGIENVQPKAANADFMNESFVDRVRNVTTKEKRAEYPYIFTDDGISYAAKKQNDRQGYNDSGINALISKALRPNGNRFGVTENYEVQFIPGCGPLTRLME